MLTSEFYQTFNEDVYKLFHRPKREGKLQTDSIRSASP